MGIMRIVALSCDVCHLWKDFGVGDATLPVHQSREQAKREGWRRKRASGKLVDVCPDCEAGREPGSYPGYWWEERRGW